MHLQTAKSPDPCTGGAAVFAVEILTSSVNRLWACYNNQSASGLRVLYRIRAISASGRTIGPRIGLNRRLIHLTDHEGLPYNTVD